MYLSGAIIGMWIPSIAPTHCGTFQRFSKTSAISFNFIESGNFMCTERRTLIAEVLHTVTYSAHANPEKLTDTSVLAASGKLPKGDGNSFFFYIGVLSFKHMSETTTYVLKRLL